MYKRHKEYRQEKTAETAARKGRLEAGGPRSRDLKERVTRHIGGLPVFPAQLSPIDDTLPARDRRLSKPGIESGGTSRPCIDRPQHEPQDTNHARKLHLNQSHRSKSIVPGRSRRAVCSRLRKGGSTPLVGLPTAFIPCANRGEIECLLPDAA